MAVERTPFSLVKNFAEANLERLGHNPYPGRGIAMGFNADNSLAVQVYWVMGRSEGSRNRILALEGDIVRTQPYIEDPAQDTSLIIYTAMREEVGSHIVSNGDQTDSIADGIKAGGRFRKGVLERSYEPDAPNFTPRISGEYKPGDEEPFSLALTRRNPENAEPITTVKTYGDKPGIGRMVHTYKGDGNPLPPYDTEPIPVPLRGGLVNISLAFWEKLNKDNRVALVAKGIDTNTGEVTFSIINAHVQS